MRNMLGLTLVAALASSLAACSSQKSTQVSAEDARDLLIASVLCDDPVLYIDDRALYEVEEELPPPGPVVLDAQGDGGG